MATIGIGYIFSYLAAEIKRNPNSFRIGIATVCLIVAFLSILESGLVNTSLIYLRMAENQAGEFDISISFDNNIIPRLFNPADLTVVLNNSGSLPLINYTKVNNISLGEAKIKGAVPRWMLTGKLINPSNHSLNTTSIILFAVI